MNLYVKRGWGGAYGLLCTHNKVNNSTERHSRFLPNYFIFLDRSPIYNQRRPSCSSGTKGSRTSYPCPIDGNPPPDFKWYRGRGTSRLINSGKNFSIFERLSTESGWYTCHAKNKLGDKIIYLHLIGKCVSECCIQITYFQ